MTEINRERQIRETLETARDLIQDLKASNKRFKSENEKLRNEVSRLHREMNERDKKLRACVSVMREKSLDMHKLLGMLLRSQVV